MNDSVMITSAVDAHEGRVVVTCDIHGALVDPILWNYNGKEGWQIDM